MDIKKFAWVNELLPIIKEFKDGSDYPLTKQEVKVLAEHIKNKINLIEGNITYDEYERIDGNLVILEKDVPDWLTSPVQAKVREILFLPSSEFEAGKGNAIYHAVKYLKTISPSSGLKEIREIVEAIQNQK